MQLLLAAILVCAVGAISLSEPSLLVNTNLGPLQGHMTTDEPPVREWKGVPFAQPPVGDLRWEYPVAPEPTSTVYEANVDVNGCAQTCVLPPGNCPSFGISEDCLYLSVKAPAEPSADPAGYPVLFWIHGGAYTQGLGNCALYNGTSFAQQGVITVVINYRLGAMGFMASASQNGNYGMLDQRMALQWVQDNIKGFGGDPTRVTAAGQSAGAMSVATHMVSPNSKGLFSKGVMESNCLGMPYHTRTSAGINADAMAGYMKCDNDDIACLKSKTMEEVLDAQANAIKVDRKTLFINFLPFAPMVEEGGELPKQPLDAMAVGEFTPMPLLSGTVTDEGVFFVNELFPDSMGKSKYHATVDAIFGMHKAKQIKKMYPMVSDDGRDAFSTLATDLIFFCPLRNVTRGMQENLGASVAPTYMYRFKHILSFDVWGPDYSFCYGKVCHGSELPFVFNVFSSYGKYPGQDISYDPNADEKQLSKDMGGAWINFISGSSTDFNPDGNSGAKLPVPMTYPPYDASTMPLVVLDEPDYSDAANLRSEQCDMWDKLGYFY